MKTVSHLVRLICWNEELPQQHADEITALGYRVDASSLHGSSAFVTHFRNLNPAAIVIDLDRLPSYGREIATVLRSSKTTRHFPIVFAGGAEEKVERLRAEISDAAFTSWKKISPTLKRTIASPPTAPIQPTPYMQRWTHTSLTRKLGIVADMQAALIGGEGDGLAEIIGELPEGAALSPRVAGDTQLVLYAVHSLHELDAALDHATAHLPKGASFWIIHQKTTSKQRGDFNQNDMRELALSRGFVDYKVCSVDARWSGLKFARRKH